MTIPPPSPRHISEISFDTINDEYNKLVCPKSPRKQQIQDQDTLNSRKFWLSTAHDLKKLHDMQKVYLYLQYAQLEPILNEKRLALYFNRWVKEIPRRRWRHFYQRLVQQKYVEEYTSEADRIKYTRMKLSAKKYKSDTFGADLDYLTKIAISTTDKLNCLTSKPEIPIKTIPPEVLSHRSRRSSKRGLNEDDLHMLNELKKEEVAKEERKEGKEEDTFANPETEAASRNSRY